MPSVVGLCSLQWRAYAFLFDGCSFISVTGMGVSDT